jgi:cystathionine beta-lyase
MKFATKAIHAGIEPDATTGAIMTPIFQTSTYVQKQPGDHKGYEYSRTHNPTRSVLQNNLAALELLSPGDEVVATDDLYGGTYRIFTTVFAKYGIKFHFIPMLNAASVEQYINTRTRMIWVETPTNPMLNIVDIKAMSALAKKNDAWLVVDNTFASPYLQTPLDLGADIVTHSLTKYISGHSDVVMGAIICNHDALVKQLAAIQNSCGATPGPMDCFLVLRGIKTLHLRMQRHCENGKLIAEFLQRHSKVDKVYWPGFSDHPNYEIAKSQMCGFGGMMSFRIKGDKMEDAIMFLSRLKLFSLAESLGGVESLVGHPATMTHASIPKDIREKSGVTDSLLRLSVGIEDVEDLIDDLKHALG